MKTQWTAVWLAVLSIGIGSPNTWADVPEYVPDEVLVKYEDGVSTERIGEIEGEFGLTLIRVLPLVDVHHYQTKIGEDVPGLTRKLTLLEEVRFAEPNWLRRLAAVNDPYYSQQWYLDNVGQEINGWSGPKDIDIDWAEAMGIFTGTLPVIVAVVDSGINLTHEDLVTRIWTNPGELPNGLNGVDDDGNGWVDDLYGLDFSEFDFLPLDEFGHGTKVAGVIAAKQNNSKGIAGISPTAAVMAMRVLDRFNRGKPLFLGVNAFTVAADYSARNGARIINLSLGGTAPSLTEDELFGTLDSMGILVVAAAGNGGDDQRGDNNDLMGFYPASYQSQNIVSVAAINRQGLLDTFSNYGGVSVDLAAPGTEIYSTDLSRRSFYFEDFEGSAAGWMAGSIEGNQSTYNWTFDSNNGNGLMQDGSGFFGSGGLYSAFTDTWGRSPLITGLSNALNAEMEFQIFYSLGFAPGLGSVDAVTLDLSADGLNWSTFQSFYGSSYGWVWRKVDISDAAGYAGVYYRFRLSTDGVYSGDGVAVDNVSITGVEAIDTGSTNYGWTQGTSFSAPIVSGVAALIMSQRPDLTHHQVKDILLSTVDERHDLTAKMVSGGTVNAHKALIAAKALPPRKPQIIQQPIGGTLHIGNSKTIRVSVVSPVTATFHWRRDGVNIPGQTGMSLTINGISTSQSGTFTCAVTNSAGTTISQGAVVTIKERSSAPIFTVHPQSQSRTVGQSVTFSASASGTPTPTYQWRRDGVNISGATGTSYTISSVTLSHAGAYSVVASNGVAPNAISQAATLTVSVAEAAPVFTVHPQSRSRTVGQSISLTAFATGTPTPTYQWRKDGVNIAGATGNSYAIAAVSLSDAGAYTVVASNGVSPNATSRVANLTVLAVVTAPAISVHPGNVELGEGGTLNLEVVASGTAPLTYQWFKDDANIIQGATTPNLEIQGIKESDAGDYWCVVTNTVGNVTSGVATVTVLATPKPANITVAPRSVAVYEGGEATLSVTAYGSTPINYLWSKDGSVLKDETHSTLTIADATIADAGNYTIRVANSDGWDAATCSVTVLKPGTGQPAMANLSNRGQVRAGNGVLIPGFVITGSEPKRLLIRGIGPALLDFGLNGALEAPEIALRRDGTVVAENVGWDSASNESAIDAVGDLLGAFGLNPGKHDCAMFVSLQPGSYTVRLGGENNTTGLGLVEVYDADPGSDSRLVNLSVRAFVGTGGDILIPGLVVNGNGPIKVLIRAVGPTLTEYGVTGVLEDPKLTLISDGSEIAVNDNWGTNSDLPELTQITSTVGAFSLTDGSSDAALIAELPPGAYTAKVKGVGGTTGVCLVEVYYVE